MRYRLLAAFCLASLCAPGWARDLNANEKKMVGMWIETSTYKDRLELFEDGTGKGVLGDYFDWRLLADNRLKADAPTFGGMRIVTSDALDSEQGYFNLEGREFIHYAPDLHATYSDLSGAVMDAETSSKKIGSLVYDVNKIQHPKESWDERDAKERLPETIGAIGPVLVDCLQRISNAVGRSPGFARTYLVKTPCLNASLDYANARIAVYQSSPESAVDVPALQSIAAEVNKQTAELDKAKRSLASLEGTLAEEKSGLRPRPRSRREAAEDHRYIIYVQERATENRKDVEERTAKLAELNTELDKKRTEAIEAARQEQPAILKSIINAYDQALAAGLPPPLKTATLNARAEALTKADRNP